MTIARTYTLLVTIHDDNQPMVADLEQTVERHLEETVGVSAATVTALSGDHVDGGYGSSIAAAKAKQLHFNLRQP